MKYKRNLSQIVAYFVASLFLQVCIQICRFLSHFCSVSLTQFTCAKAAKRDRFLLLIMSNEVKNMHQKCQKWTQRAKAVPGLFHSVSISLPGVITQKVRHMDNPHFGSLLQCTCAKDAKRDGSSEHHVMSLMGLPRRWACHEAKWPRSFRGGGGVPGGAPAAARSAALDGGTVYELWSWSISKSDIVPKILTH